MDQPVRGVLVLRRQQLVERHREMRGHTASRRTRRESMYSAHWYVCRAGLLSRSVYSALDHPMCGARVLRRQQLVKRHREMRGHTASRRSSRERMNVGRHAGRPAEPSHPKHFRAPFSCSRCHSAPLPHSSTPLPVGLNLSHD